MNTNTALRMVGRILALAGLGLWAMQAHASGVAPTNDFFLLLNDQNDYSATCPPPPGREGLGDCSGASLKGMPQWSMTEPYCNLWVKDIPLGYQPAKGPAVALLLSYKQRDEGAGVSANEFSFGQGWNCDWRSYVALEAGRTNVFLPGGGVVVFTNAGVDFHSNARLETQGANGFRFLYADGRTNAYAFAATIDGQPRCYLTAIIDRVGQKLTLQYDSNTNAARLLRIIDAEGRTNTLAYETDNLVRSVTDVYGHSNVMAFNAAGQLTNIVDVAGLGSSFRYETNGWMTHLITPYGTNTFEAQEGTNNGNYRWLRVTDAGGGRHLWVFRSDLRNVLAAGTDALANSFYWGPRQYDLLPNTTNLTALTDDDYLRARRKNWNRADHAGYDPVGLMFEQEFSPDLATAGQRTVYEYNLESPQMQPWKVSRTFQGELSYVQADRNELGAVTNEISSYSGGTGERTRSFLYSEDGLDLLETYDFEGHRTSATGYVNHLPVVVTNILGEPTGFTYANGQVTSISRPGGLLTTNIYFAPGENYAGWLQRTEDWIAGTPQRTNSFTYTNGLVETHTDERARVTTNYWDPLGRLTGTSDGLGATTNLYEKLDLVCTVDRMGFTNRFVYDNMRRLKDSFDALGHHTHYDHCTCGALNSVTEAWGTDEVRSTVFEFDQAGRTIKTIFPGDYWVTNELNLLGQVVSTTDSAGTSITNFYNNQGLLFCVSNAWGQVSRVEFDIHDRVTSSVDANGVTVTNAFDLAGRLLATGTPANGALQTFGYTANIAGPTSFTNALTNVTLVAYDAYGRKLAVTNANHEVTSFSYEPDGGLKTLTDGLNHITTWNYDSYRRLTNKVDHLGTNVFALVYDYNSRVTNRWTPAKGTTSYGHDAIGNLTSVNHPNSPDLTLQYDALNQLTNLVDAVGTTKFSYTAAGQLESEDEPWTNDTVTYSYQHRLRSRMLLTNSFDITYGWDAATKRLMSVASPAGTFGYSYRPAMPTLVEAIALPSGHYITNNFDDLGRLLATSLFNATNTLVNSHVYDYNLGDQRTKQTRTDGSFVDYDYDPLGQLKTALAKELGGETNRLHEQFGFGYDAGGNVRQKTNNALAQTFNVNAVNELTTRTRTGTLTVSGETTGPATNVTVNGGNAALYADYTFAKDGLADGTNTFTAIALGTYGMADTNIVSVSLPGTQPFAYDFNGNLTSDGKRGLEYDDENQLAVVIVTNQFKREFQYDGLRRMRVRKEFAWVSGAWAQTNETRFIYDGLVIVQTRDGNNTPTLSFTRGLDLSGSFQGAGGTGGLLALADHTATAALLKTALYHADGNGNVTCLISTNGLILAKALFEPFGAPLALSGPLAGVNPFWFSSQLYDSDTGFSHYLYRAYSADLQRWLTKDPIGERGGANLFQFGFSDPIGVSDIYGLDCVILVGRNKENPEYFTDIAESYADAYFRVTGQRTHIFQVRSIGDIQKALQTTNITDLVYYGHATSDRLYLSENDLATTDVSKLNFSNVNTNSRVKLMGCRTAAGTNSIAQAFANQLNQSVVGMSGGLSFGVPIPLWPFKEPIVILYPTVTRGSDKVVVKPQRR